GQQPITALPHRTLRGHPFPVGPCGGGVSRGNATNSPSTTSMMSRSPWRSRPPDERSPVLAVDSIHSEGLACRSFECQDRASHGRAGQDRGATTDPSNGVTYGYNMAGADPNTCAGAACSVTIEA